MQNAQLQAMTVVQLRKLAKENGVKLSAGIDKSGIVARLSEALPDEPDVQTAAPEQPETPQVAAPAPQPALEAEKEEETPAETQERLQEAPLSADVTAVSPGGSGFRAWNNPQEQGGFRPVYRQAWQARSTSRENARAPAWPDHLDIYGTEEAYLESFRHYTTLIQPGGALIIRKGISLQPKVQPGLRVYNYSRDEGDFHAENIRIGNGEIFIDFVAPDTRINDIQLGIPVSINIENGVAAMALAHLNGVTDEEIKKGMASFRGVDRRFDFKIKNDRVVFLSDYAHHPSEIKQSVLSMRELYKDKKITAIFQPHLYTRTRDFYQDFADSLSLLDEVILVDIYPAREAPIPGITSKLIYDNLRPGIEKSMCKKEDILNILKDKNIEVLITLGAGDIDNYVPEICKILENR